MCLPVWWCSTSVRRLPSLFVLVQHHDGAWMQFIRNAFDVESGQRIRYPLTSLWEFVTLELGPHKNSSIPFEWLV
jgi:hypothetical protein